MNKGYGYLHTQYLLIETDLLDGGVSGRTIADTMQRTETPNGINFDISIPKVVIGHEGSVTGISIDRRLSKQLVVSRAVNALSCGQPQKRRRIPRHVDTMLITG